MKRLLAPLMLSISLMMCGCDMSATKKNNDDMYSQITCYRNVEYRFGSDMRCDVDYYNWDTDTHKTWSVYLNGFYVKNDTVPDSYYYAEFYECELSTAKGHYHYYLMLG